MIDVLVVADDRTGALETAGLCADAGGVPVPVHVGALRSNAGAVVVVDLQTRHIAASRAAELAAGVESVSAVRAAHKIDSTLRGNWAHELVARHRAGRERVLLVLAFPELGRTCVRGVVYEHGRPVADRGIGSDARRLIDSSRPAEHLRRAGAPAVAELADASAVTAWLADPNAAEFAVCDAETDASMHAVGLVWAGSPQVLLAGTAASIAAGLASLVRGPSVTAAVDVALSALSLPALVVCGSLNAVARRQIAALRAVGAAAANEGEKNAAIADALRQGGVAVLVSPEPTVFPVADDEAVFAADRLARSASAVIAAGSVRTVLLIGGDTAAAVLGDGEVLVGGTVAPGMPWIHRSNLESPLVLTRAGGFGGDDALVRLFRAGRRS